MEANELKPCPWCGSKDIVIDSSEICCPIEWSSEARCLECYATSSSGGVHSEKSDSELEATKIWNDRPTMQDAAPEMYEMLERLKVVVDDYDYDLFCSRGVGEWSQPDVSTEIDALLAKARGE